MPPSTSSNPRSWIINAIRQLKLIVPGAMTTYYLGTLDKLVRVLQSEDDAFHSKVAFVALGNVFVMMALIFYVLFLIYRKDGCLDWRTWRESGSLSVIIPVLTATIVVGWILHVLILGSWTTLGYTQGFVGATSLYALIFGTLALIPVPRKRKET